MSETKPETADTEPDQYEITSDDVENEPGTGVEAKRDVVVNRPDGRSRRARFTFDADRQVYRLEAYSTKAKTMLVTGITFVQADVDALSYVADYLRETRENVDVELFVGERDE